MGFGWGIVSEVSFTPHTVRVINPLVLPKLELVSMRSRASSRLV